MANYGGATTTQHQAINGLFRDKESAERAYDVLERMGYTRDETSVVMSNETRDRHFSVGDGADTGLGSKAMEGAGVGGAIGTTAGGLLGALLAIGASVAIPGLGIVVAGPLLGALAGAGAGGLTGGLIGALVGSGIPEENAKSYQEAIKGGSILISVVPRSESDAETIRREWRDLGNATITP